MWPHTGSWGTPDFGATELLQKVLTAPIAVLQGKSPSTVNQAISTKQGGSNLIGASGSQGYAQATVNPTAPMSTPVNSSPGGVLGTNDVNNTTTTKSGTTTLGDAAKASEDAATAAAEAKRISAMNAYSAKVGEANTAKSEALGTYNWIIDTLGSNKKDLLAEVTRGENTGVANYGLEETKTKGNYDTARQEILSTYRDLQTAQEKVLRGSGVGQSSRAQEAALRLNNLMGKDLTTVSTNEADALALIGNAVSALHTKAEDSRLSIERDAKGKADQAGLEYQKQIDTINNNLNLSANEREDAYNAASTQLATDVAAIKTWQAQQEAVMEKNLAGLTSHLDNFIVDMTSDEGLLSSGLAEKTTATNQVLSSINQTPLTVETGVTTPIASIYRKPASKNDLDKQLADGEITQEQYNSQIQALGATPGASTAATTPTATEDPLLKNLLGTAIA